MKQMIPIAKLTSAGEVVTVDGATCLVCDCCGLIYPDEDGNHHDSCQCGRLACRMEWPTADGMKMAALEIKSFNQSGDTP